MKAENHTHLHVRTNQAKFVVITHLTIKSYGQLIEV